MLHPAEKNRYGATFSYENKTMNVDMDGSIAGILPRGGTILRTSRTNPAKREGELLQRSWKSCGPTVWKP